MARCPIDSNPLHTQCDCRRLIARLSLLMTMLASGAAWCAQSGEECKKITADADRLACYDRQIMPTVESGKSNQSAKDESLSERWELSDKDSRGLWSFQAHKPNYFLFGRYTNNVNLEPYAIYFDAINNRNVTLDDVESKFQLSFKIKALDNVLGADADLWVGYTQQNHWQVYNKDISAPFRETNYEPEIFLTVPLHWQAMSLDWRFANLGLVHQSNGQSNLLSRSWNRVFVQVGAEHSDQLSLLLKAWARIEESPEDDDNPDITNYLGNFEAIGSLSLGKNHFTVLGRITKDLNRGYVQLDWSYPLIGKMRAYIQATTGYGESLIDYNHRQDTIGVGIMLTDWK